MEMHRGDGFPVEFNDYNIRWSSNNLEGGIKDIQNKRFGAIRFAASKLDQECGYVPNSRAQIYTCEYKDDMLNIIHAHINDMSEAVTLEVEYMADGQTEAEFQEFKKDEAGLMLRYRILVKDQRVYKMLYNQGEGNIVEIPFEEFKVSLGQVMISKKSNETYHKIQQVPICMMASKDKQKLNGIYQGSTKFDMNDFCMERGFERLPGFVDIHVVSSIQVDEEGEQKLQLLNEPVPHAIPICKLLHVNEEQLARYTQLIEEEKYSHECNVRESIQSFDQLLQSMESNKEIAKDISSMELALSQLQIEETQIEQIIEENNKETSEEDKSAIKELCKRALQLKKRFATETRILKMRGAKH